MADRSSRPRSSPRRTPQPIVRKIVHLRWKQRLGPVAIAAKVGLAASTVPRILVACRINRLWHVDRVTGEPIRRYEMIRPGELVHVDLKKLGDVPSGGGWRAPGRGQGRPQQPGPPRPRPPAQGPRPANLGYCYVHSAIDGYSRLAYSEALDDETAATALAFWARARTFFAGHGITFERVLTDNGAAYKSHAWRDAHQQLGVQHSGTRVRRPQTNGKVERLNRTRSRTKPSFGTHLGVGLTPSWTEALTAGELPVLVSRWPAHPSKPTTAEFVHDPVED